MNTKENKQKWMNRVDDVLTLGGRSDRTIRNYKYGINHFLNSFDENTKISSFKEEQIANYLRKEYLDKNCTTTTYNFNLSVIRFFYSVCFKKEFNNRILPKAKIGKRLPKIISKEQFISLINNEKNLEHKCWLILGFCSGLRIEEIATLRIENIDSKNHKLTVIGKGNKERMTLLPDVVIKLLRLYYVSKNMKTKEGYLFKGCEGNEHISVDTICNYFPTLSKANNLDDGITFHTLRHSFATYFIMNGGDLLVLKDMLGHRSLSTTAIYVHLANDFNNLKGVNYV